MDTEEANNSRTPPLVDLSRPSKRQRLTSDPSNSDTSDTDSSPPITEWTFEQMKKDFEDLRSQVDQTEAATLQYHKTQLQTEEFFEKERNRLEMQLQLDNKELSQLQEDLTISIRNTEDAIRAKKSAESGLSQMKIVINQKISPLIMGLITEDAPLVQDISTEPQKTPKPAAEMDKPLENDSMSRKKSFLEKIQLKEAKEQTNALKARANRAEKLEEELQIAGDTISSLHEALEQQESSIKEKLEEIEKLQEQVNMLQSAGDHGGNSDLDNTASSSDQNQNADFTTDSEILGMDQESIILEDEEPQRDDSQLFMGKKKYRFFALNPELVDIDWDEEFTRKDKSTWVCKTCSLRFSAKVRMQDHVWAVHYRGKFQCPQCTDPPHFAPWRATIVNHIRKHHT